MKKPRPRQRRKSWLEIVTIRLIAIAASDLSSSSLLADFLPVILMSTNCYRPLPPIFKRPPPVRLSTCPYSTDATYNPPADQPETLNTISRLTLTISGLTFCGYCLSSSVSTSHIVFVSMPCKNPNLFDALRHHHPYPCFLSPFTSTHYSKEARNSTT